MYFKDDLTWVCYMEDIRILLVAVLCVSISQPFMSKLPYVTYCDLQGDCRSKVMLSKEMIYMYMYMNSYLLIIVTQGLSGSVTEIWHS